MTPNLSAIDRLSREIFKANVRGLVIVHGGGSFGHPIAKAYNIREGYRNPSQLIGFSETRQAMTSLNQLIMKALIGRRISAVSVQPSSLIITEEGRIKHMDTRVIENMLELGLTPVLYGDAVLDSMLGFTILSGDQLVANLAIRLHAKQIIVGVDVDGLYTADPKVSPSARLLDRVTLNRLEQLIHEIGGAKTIDVTGGMLGKIVELLSPIREGVQVKIINIKRAGRLYRALRNQRVVGTILQKGEFIE